ncbi:MAG: hypothetical protein HPAVJP_4310 [Candidatus Hepatoplasma vulgare]|nr:MAG: hypothetical protein HPAVJP_4310 [Candidatus Hepatoplasma sp.]
MESKNFLIPKGFCQELIVEEDDNELKNISQKFINILDEENEKYIEEKNKKENEFKEYINDKNAKNYFFEPEILSRRSPLTIINAPWGSGKTFFIENLIKLAIDEKEKGIDFKNFKKIIIIDAWKYSNSENIPDEIMSELFSIFIKLYPKYKEIFKKIAYKIFNTAAIPWAKKINIDINKIDIERKENENIIDYFKKTSIEKTIVFFDNIERIGKKSWEILKAIFKIQQFDNFVFVLPMNIKGFKNNEKNNSEYPIEKFIDIKYFEFKQNYLSLIKGMGFHEKEVKIINSILDTEIDGQKLSIREVKQRFIANNILNIKNEYERLYKIFKNIWGSSLILKEKINKVSFEIYTKKREFKEETNEFFNLISKEINKFELTEKIREIINELWKNTKMEELLRKSKRNNFIQINDYDYFKNFLTEAEKNLEIFLNENNKNIKKEKNNLTENENLIENYKSNKKENNDKIINLKKENPINHKEVVILETVNKKNEDSIYLHNKKIIENNKKISVIKNEIEKSEFDLLLIKEIKNKFTNKLNLLKDKKVNIDLFIKEKNENLLELSEKYEYNFENKEDINRFSDFNFNKLNEIF